MRLSTPILIFLLIFGTGCAAISGVYTPPCTMQAWHQGVDALPSPAYPQRNHTGDEFLLMGVIRDAETCQPIADATVMFDMTNATGDYDGVNQGTTMTNTLGLFMIMSNRPGAYGGGPPHIHLFVGAPDYATITTAHNLLTDDTQGWIDITLDRAG